MHQIRSIQIVVADTVKLKLIKSVATAKFFYDCVNGKYIIMFYNIDKRDTFAEFVFYAAIIISHI